MYYYCIIEAFFQVWRIAIQTIEEERTIINQRGCYAIKTIILNQAKFTQQIVKKNVKLLLK